MAAVSAGFFGMPPYEQPYDFVLFPNPDAYPDSSSRPASTHEPAYNFHQVAFGPAELTSEGYLSSVSMASSDPRSGLTMSPYAPYHEGYPALVGHPQETLKQAPCLVSRTRSPPPAFPPATEAPNAMVSHVSGPSIPSASSSTLGSPCSAASHTVARPDGWAHYEHGLGIVSGGFVSEGFAHENVVSAGVGSELAFIDEKRSTGYVDPSLIQPFHTPGVQPTTPVPNIGEVPTLQSPHMTTLPSQSPKPSHPPLGVQRRGSANLRSGGPTPYQHNRTYQPYDIRSSSRRQTISPQLAHAGGRGSLGSPSVGSAESDDDDGNQKGRCPHPDCGRVFKDLKAHMLTHQAERPEKCPIVNCDWHYKGFARKYDKNRHTLTHYKGTMICFFCPGSGSVAEKSFNRADVFKRHLTSVHHVEQTPPNSRRKSSAGAAADGGRSATYPRDVTGKCSTCSGTFDNAQDFYEHLDDCVLRIVQQEDPGDAINARHLSSMDNDEAVIETFRSHDLLKEDGTLAAPTSSGLQSLPAAPEDDDSGGDGDGQGEHSHPGSWSTQGAAPEEPASDRGASGTQ